MRKILAREEPLEFKGEHYQIPYTGPGATGLGKPLKSILHGRKDLPIYTASIGPAGIERSAEVADGVIPVWMNPERFDLLEPHLEEGFAKAGGGKRLDGLRRRAVRHLVLGDDVERCRMPVKGMLALYIGGMGARGKNFYNDYAKRLGYEAEAVKIQDLYLDGKKDEAMAAVPDKLVDEIALVGPKERIRDRLAAWKALRRHRPARRRRAARGAPRGLALGGARARWLARVDAMSAARERIVALDKRRVWHPYTPMDRYRGGGRSARGRCAPRAPYLYDADGRGYLDANSSWWVASLGHNHPRLVAALERQARAQLPQRARRHDARAGGRARRGALPRRARRASSTSSTATTARPPSRSR